MAALLALIPSRDWFYGAIIVALIGFVVYERQHLINEGVAKADEALQASSTKLQAAAIAHNTEIAKAYTASSAKITGDLDAQVKAANAQHDSDAQRLREFDAYRSQHPPVAHTAPTIGSKDPGATSSFDVNSVLARLEQVSLGLATSDRTLAAALTACMQDRDSLTGKP